MVHYRQGSPQMLQNQWSGTEATLVSQCLLLVAQAHIQMEGFFVCPEQEPMTEEQHLHARC